MDEHRRDGRFLHFAKELPDRYPLYALTLAMAGLYSVTRVGEILQLLIMLVGALIALSTKKNVPGEQTGNINADAVNAETLNVEKKK